MTPLWTTLFHFDASNDCWIYQKHKVMSKVLSTIELPKVEVIECFGPEFRLLWLEVKFWKSCFLAGQQMHVVQKEIKVDDIFDCCCIQFDVAINKWNQSKRHFCNKMWCVCVRIGRIRYIFYTARNMMLGVFMFDQVNVYRQHIVLYKTLQ